MNCFLLDWYDHINCSISKRKYIAVYGECSDRACISELAWSYVHTPHDTPSVYREPAPAEEGLFAVVLMWDRTHNPQSCWLLHAIIRVILIWLCCGYFLQAVVWNAVRPCMEPVRRARPWAASTMTAASPAVRAVSISSHLTHTHLSNSLSCSLIDITYYFVLIYFSSPKSQHALHTTVE